MERYYERMSKRDNGGHSREESAEERRDIIIREMEVQMEVLARQMCDLDDRVNQQNTYLKIYEGEEEKNRYDRLDVLSKNYSGEAFAIVQRYIYLLKDRNPGPQPRQMRDEMRRAVETFATVQNHIDLLSESNPGPQPQQMREEMHRVLNAAHAIIQNSQENLTRLRQEHQFVVRPLNSELSELKEQYMDYEEEISHIIDAFREKTPTPDPDDDVLRWRC
jgi:hypothetical protein